MPTEYDVTLAADTNRPRDPGGGLATTRYHRPPSGAGRVSDHALAPRPEPPGAGDQGAPSVSWLCTS